MPQPFRSTFWRDQYALARLNQHQKGQWSPIFESIPASISALRVDDAEKPQESLKVGIIGAGAAGMYAAMILDSFNIECEILEASDRHGGRAYTHNFGQKEGQEQADGEWNYFDVGPMRYPDTLIMWRVFDLFRRRLGLEAQGKLLEYHMKSKNQCYLYNGIQYRGDPTPPKDVFKDLDINGSAIPTDSDWVKMGVGHWMKECLCPFVKLLTDGVKEPVTEGPRWKLLMKYDEYSIRSFMAQAFDDKDSELGFELKKKEYPNYAIEWLERMTIGTGMYDLSFTELVLDELDFNYPGGADNYKAACFTAVKYGGDSLVPPPGWKWYCLRGGSQVLTNAMADKINTYLPERIHYNSQVTSITPQNDGESVIVAYQEGGKEITKTKSFTHVISTISLPTLRLVNLDRCGLNYHQLQGARTLGYVGSCKVGMKFKKRWWQEQDIIGGQSKTDRLSRVVVFPSYGVDDPEADAVMIASYTWSRDASRIRGLMKGRGTPEERILINSLLKDLALLHGIPYESLKEQLVDWYAWDWEASPRVLGAFAQFGPGQFKNIYEAWGKPAAGGRLFFAGEALSTRHGWVEGGLQSAYDAIFKLFCLTGRSKDDLEDAWGHKEVVKGEADEGEDLFAKEWVEVMSFQAIYGAAESEVIIEHADDTESVSLETRQEWLVQKIAEIAAKNPSAFPLDFFS